MKSSGEKAGRDRVLRGDKDWGPFRGFPAGWIFAGGESLECAYRYSSFRAQTVKASRNSTQPDP